MARMFYHNPTFGAHLDSQSRNSPKIFVQKFCHGLPTTGILDECTSAVSVDAEEQLYAPGVLTQGGQGGHPAAWPRDCMGFLPTSC